MSVNNHKGSRRVRTEVLVTSVPLSDSSGRRKDLSLVNGGHSTTWESTLNSPMGSLRPNERSSASMAYPAASSFGGVVRWGRPTRFGPKLLGRVAGGDRGRLIASNAGTSWVAARNFRETG